MKSIMPTKLIRIAFSLFSRVTVVACAGLFFVNAASGSVVDLGAAANFAALTTNVGTSGAVVDFHTSSTVIGGDVGLGPYSTGAADKGQIQGNLYIDSTSTTTIGSTLTVSGTTFTNQNLSQPVADAFTASNFAAGLAATQTFGSLSGSATFNGTNGLNVIDLTAINMGGANSSITINGSASSKFVFNIQSGFIFSGTMTLTGGVTPGNILWNFNGSGTSGAQFKVGSTVAYGTFLAPQADLILEHSTLYGQLIGGGNGHTFEIGSGAQLIFSAVPEVTPSSVIFGFVGLIVAVSSRRALMGRVRAIAPQRNSH